jgi:hypothetical protein
MVRITLATPEDLRYRLKLAMMDHRRKNRSRTIQDEFCMEAIVAHLNRDERDRTMPEIADPLAAFLRDCLDNRGLTRIWAPKAKALLATLQSNSGPAPTAAGSHSIPGT